MAPGQPPTRPKKMSVLSDTRHRPATAADLSTTYTTKRYDTGGKVQPRNPVRDTPDYRDQEVEKKESGNGEVARSSPLRGRVASSTRRTRKPNLLYQLCALLSVWIDLDFEREALADLRSFRTNLKGLDVYEYFLTALRRIDEPEAALVIPRFESAVDPHDVATSSNVAVTGAALPYRAASALTEELEVGYVRRTLSA